MSSRTLERVDDAPTGEDAPISVLLVHSDELLLAGARALLERQPWVGRCVLATDAEQGLALAIRERPSVVVIRSCSPDGGPPLANRLTKAVPTAKVMRFGETRAREFVNAVQQVAHGSTDEFLDENRPRLSVRELQVLEHLSSGASNSEIGRRLFLSPHTVKQHVQRICRKLGAQNRVEAITRARASGLFE